MTNYETDPQKNRPKSISKRQARVSPSGCGVFLTAAELQALGVNPETADIVEYSVSADGCVHFTTISGEGP